MRACLASFQIQRAWERAERNEAARGHSIRSCAKKSAWVHAESWASPAESVQTVIFAHATTPTRCCEQQKLVSTSMLGGVHLHQTRCYSFPFCRAIRSGRSAVPKNKKGSNACSSSFQKFTVFLGLQLNLFVSRDRSAPIHVANNISIRLVPLLSGGWFKTRPEAP